MISKQNWTDGRRWFGAAVLMFVILMLAMLAPPGAANDLDGNSEGFLSGNVYMGKTPDGNDSARLMSRVGHPPYDPEWISAGWAHTCGLRIDGKMDCWGVPINDFGQTQHRDGPFSQIAVGSHHTCGLYKNGNIECWGDVPITKEGPFTQVVAGWSYTCGLKDDGTVQCWGDTEEWQVATPTDQFSQISAGGKHVCGIKIQEGTVDCWGDWEYESPTGSFLQISAGNYHTCGILTDLSVDCWGYNLDAGGGIGG